jgi:hypothetical protein
VRYLIPFLLALFVAGAWGWMCADLGWPGSVSFVGGLVIGFVVPSWMLK